MSSIEERELREAANEGSLKELTITELEGGYQLSVRLTWKKESLQMVAQRGKPRSWVSLDRLIKHVKKHYHIHLINLILEEGEESKDEKENT